MDSSRDSSGQLILPFRPISSHDAIRQQSAVFLNLFSCRPLGTEGEILALAAALRITSATALLNPPRILDGEGRRMIYCPAVATQKF